MPALPRIRWKYDLSVLEPALHSAGIDTVADDSVLMRQVLDKLSQRERLVCIWKLAGFSTRDIARHLGRSDAAIDSVFTRAKRKLRRSLREHGWTRHDSSGSPP